MILKTHILIILFCQIQQLQAQQIYLPEPLTNHASAILRKDKKDFLYTFYGLDSSKTWKGVHQKTFRVEISKGAATQIGNVPDTMGRLAAAASVIKNKAYIVGGYAVFENGKEQSSKNLFIFDPINETFTKGAHLPIAIDDHIQSVWRDSLLYIVSGWNDSLNVYAVQVYNPANNTWQLATELPHEKTAAVFGGSGVIYGDTIYMLGGAQFDKNYPASPQFYKGRINSDNPLQIKWNNAGSYPLPFRYRSVAFVKNKELYFFGGSNETYNYNGMAYLNKKPVLPNTKVLVYNVRLGRFTIRRNNVNIMDIRNVGITKDNHFYISGGMGIGQKVLKTIIRLQLK